MGKQPHFYSLFPLTKELLKRQAPRRRDFCFPAFSQPFFCAVIADAFAASIFQAALLCPFGWELSAPSF
jgi:hypothetical protein